MNGPYKLNLPVGGLKALVSGISYSTVLGADPLCLLLLPYL